MSRTGLVLAAAAWLAACGEANVTTFKTVPISPFMGEPVLGDPKSPVEIIEYASTTCGHCWALHEKVMPDLKTAYIDTGKAHLRYRVMPTPPPEISMAGAAIARCAGEAKFFEVITDLFDHQEQLLGAARSPGRVQQLLVAVGGRHGLTPDEVGTCINDKAIQAATIKGVADAPSFVTGTPTLIVNGEVVAEHSLAALSQAIDARLNAKAAN